MKITKTTLFKNLVGKVGTYAVDKQLDGKSVDYETYNNYIINDVKSQLETYNKNRGDKPKITCDVDGDVLNISNGQFIMLVKAPKSGAISVNSSFISVAGVRIDKKNIIADSITENSFKTINSSIITFK